MAVGAGVNSVVQAGPSSSRAATNGPPINHPAAESSASAAPPELNAPKPITPEPAAAERAPSDPEAPEPALFQWRYETVTDEISGKTIRGAMLISETTYNFDFPYHGGTFCGLRIAEHPRGGLTVTLNVNKGQFTCRSFTNCRIEVRFDDRPPIKFRGVEPASYDTKTIFLQPEKEFLKELKNSSSMVIELPFYREGNRIFRFNTANLTW